MTTSCQLATEGDAILTLSLYAKKRLNVQIEVPADTVERTFSANMIKYG